MESIRKDVECFYGILKNRFRFCLGPIEVRDYEVIESAFQCCTMIHNLILDYDKDFHSECCLWEDINWERLAPDVSEEDLEEMLESAREEREEENLIPFLPQPELAEGAILLKANNKQDYHKLKELLIASFTQQFEMGQVYWPSRFEGWQPQVPKQTSVVIASTWKLLPLRIKEVVDFCSSFSDSLIFNGRPKHTRSLLGVVQYIVLWKGLQHLFVRLFPQLLLNLF